MKNSHLFNTIFFSYNKLTSNCYFDHIRGIEAVEEHRNSG